MEKLHTRLRRLRQAHRMTMKESAAAIGVPESTYRDWEYGGSVRGQYYPKIADVLGVSIHELLTGERVQSDRVTQAVQRLDQSVLELKAALRTGGTP